MFLTNPSEVELPWKNLAINIIPNLVASIIGFLVALVIYRRIDKEIEQEELVNKIKEQMPQPVTVTPAPDLSKMENLLEKTVGKWRSNWNPEGVCSIDSIGCPSELKNIYKKYNLTATGNEDWLKRINLLLSGRLEEFNKQIAEVENGKWLLMSKGGDLLTDADVTYNIISDKFLYLKSDIVIKAVTILPYIKWWITPIGLKYLERQRKFKVSRIFLFPDEVFPILYSDLFNTNSNGQQVKKSFEEANNLRLDERLIRIVLYIHYLLGIKVFLLSPAILRNKTSDKNCLSTVIDWQSRDTAIFQKAGESTEQNICAIQIKTFPGTFSEYLIADEGTVYFNDKFIQKDILDNYDIISPHAINFNEHIDNATIKPNGELAGIAEVLKYDLVKKQFKESCALDEDDVQKAIRDFIKKEV